MSKLTRLLAAAVIPFLVCALLFGCRKESEPPEPTTEFTFEFLTTEEDPWDTTTEEETTEEETTEEETEPTTTTTRKPTTTTKKTTTTTKTTTKAPTTTTANKNTTIPDVTTIKGQTTTKAPTTSAPTTTKAPTTTVPPTTVPVTGVAFTGGVSTYTLKAGATHNLGNSYTVSPGTATNKKVRWFSVPSSIASVSSTGLVTALKEGECQIFVETEDGGFQAFVTFNVEIIPVATINLSSAGGVSTVKQGGTLQINKSILPANATNQNVTWTSSDTSIATVSSTGLVSAVNKGDNVERYVKITATAADGKGAERFVDITVTTS